MGITEHDTGEVGRIEPPYFPDEENEPDIEATGDKKKKKSSVRKWFDRYVDVQTKYNPLSGGYYLWNAGKIGWDLGRDGDFGFWKGLSKALYNALIYIKDQIKRPISAIFQKLASKAHLFLIAGVLVLLTLFSILMVRRMVYSFITYDVNMLHIFS